jgi:hypothetical protein
VKRRLGRNTDAPFSPIAIPTSLIRISENEKTIKKLGFNNSYFVDKWQEAGLCRENDRISRLKRRNRLFR